MLVTSNSETKGLNLDTLTQITRLVIVDATMSKHVDWRLDALTPSSGLKHLRFDHFPI